MNDPQQATFGSDGKLRTDDDTADESDDEEKEVTNDLGDERGENEPKSAVNRYAVSSPLCDLGGRLKDAVTVRRVALDLDAPEL
ncbi:hypothetical protein [Halomicrococcus sp. NG-SE-24]|uniref:hypothetical protein n=1 Tax=Halomicrococcus sp. NG-SE-24 TaxID=3436928 RepID=UPI003D95995E